MNSRTHEALHAVTNSPTTAAIAAYNVNGEGTGAAIYGKKTGKGHAGFFDGEVFVTRHIGTSGNVTLLEGSMIVEKGDVILQRADCAEEFEVAPTSPSEPGTVMVLSEENRVSQSVQAYDTRVAGVISGAG